MIMTNRIIPIFLGGGGIQPSGTANLDTNGIYNITEFANVNVNCNFGFQITNTSYTLAGDNACYINFTVSFYTADNVIPLYARLHNYTNNITTDFTSIERGANALYLSDLTPGQTNYVVVQVLSYKELKYSTNVEVQAPASLPEVYFNTSTVTDTMIDILIYGDSGGGTVSRFGVCYSTSSNPTISDNVVWGDPTQLYEQLLTISGLTPNTTYYIKGFIENEIGSNYSSEMSVTTDTQTINYLTFTAEEPNTVVKFIKNGTSSNNRPYIEYYLDGSSWTSYDFYTAPDIILSNVGDKVYLRGSGNNGDNTRLSISTSNYTSVSVTSGKISASGDINTLLNGVGGDITLGQFAFYAFFKNCNVTQAPELPSTTLANNCYNNMFSGSGITSIPSNLLHATTLATSCYQNMFANTTNLTSIPSGLLPVTTLANSCYYGMFSGSGITSIPSNLLPATTLAGSCYKEMFRNTSLTSIPSGLLPATTIVISCYYGMFSGTAITSIPSNLLPATTLTDSCYYEMFSNITTLTSIPSDLLPATTLANNCYKGMFSGTAITSIPSNLLPATTLAANCYQNMFSGTSLTSIPSNLLPATTLAQYCYSSMFSNITTLTSIPSGLLPATTLAMHCYREMFRNTSLTSIPSGLLPATTMVSNCYREMFRNTSLTSIPSGLLPATTMVISCYYEMFAETSLTSIPSDLLPATTLATSCYSGMFSNITTLTSIPSDLLPATNLANSCYSSMFAGTSLTSVEIATVVTNMNYTTSMANMFANCSSLNSVTIHFPTWTASRATNWLSGVSATGDFYNLGGATIPVGTNGIPTGWTEHTSL